MINKIDRPDARPNEVLNEVFDTLRRTGGRRGPARFPLHLRLGQGRVRLARSARDVAATSSRCFDLIVEKVPGPEVDPDRPLQMLCTTLDFSEYVGRIAIGRIVAGRVTTRPEGAC